MLPEPVIEFVDDTHVRGMEDFTILTTAGRLTVKVGFVSDGASTSVAGALPGYHAFEGDTFPAAYSHDALYAGELVERDEADGILYDLLRANGVGWFRANTYWLAVRAFGGLVWKGHTQASIKAARLICFIET